MKKILKFLILPPHITDFERRYLERVNRIALAFFALHVPVFVAIAWMNHTRPLLAAALSSAVLIGPAIARAALTNPRSVSMVYGVTAMFMGGLLVHFGQGPVQIEMHFYFFSLVAMCAVFGNPMVIVAAAVTVALHHLIVWIVLPRSVFNYDAAWWVVAVHAAFVVLESIAACFIARSFFDNVIGLERIVRARTADIRLLLDNVEQGFLTIDRAGVPARERSAAVDRWFGAFEDGASWFDHLAKAAPAFAAASKLAWDEVVADVMPIELTLAQMPKRFKVGATEFRVEYQAIGGNRYLVIVTDVTTEVAREIAEAERREGMAVFERVLVDRSGFESFFEEGQAIVDVLVKASTTEKATVTRLLHTLKGNAALYGLASIATMCHELEDFIAAEGTLPGADAYAKLADRWARLATDIETLLGRRGRAIEIDEAQYAALEGAVLAGEPRDALLRKVRALKLEPASLRLAHFGEQAQRIALRLDKGDVRVNIEDNGVRLDARRWAGFWSTFIHAIRNSLDHGIEAPATRVAAGKPAEGTLSLRTFERAQGIVVEVADDGRGIDWQAVAQRARQAGLLAETNDDLQRALFVDGVSTAASVTDLSGRGVGLGALLEGTRALGGNVAIESRPGHGTLVRMTFPTCAASAAAAA